MIEQWEQLFSSSNFMPHGACYLWQPWLLWLHVVSDAVIVLAYFSIPFALFQFVRKRTDFKFPWIISLFGLFILLCGMTHLLGIWTVWQPAYWVSGLIKGATAIVSATTAVLVWPLLPKLLALPSPTQLIEVNKELAHSVDNYQKAVNELRKFSLAVEFSSTMVLISGKNGEVEYCNPAYSKFTGFSKDELLSDGASLHQLWCADKGVGADIWQTVSAGKHWHGEYRDRRKNGETYWRMESVAPVQDDSGDVINFVSVSHDISERKQSEDTIRRLAFFDPLTGLPNRSLFKERIEQAKLQSDRNQTGFALLYLDLDRFKNINDSLGHPIGDSLLVAVGERIQRRVRATDTVARLGGDEFAVIANSLDKPEQASNVANKIIGAIGEVFIIGSNELVISTSIGISLYPQDADEIEKLIIRADSAMYKSKDLGRNQFQFCSGGNDIKLMDRLALETQLRHAIERDELCLHYQPKIDLETGQINSVEALLRWQHSERGLVPPSDFIPLAEESGLIVPIGEWVFKVVCEQIKLWDAGGDERNLSVAVNLSGRQFREDDLVGKIENIVDQAGVQADRLEIEITESTIIDNPDQAIQTLTALRSKGFRLSIDDFGTGYSSLGYLKRFPLTTLKIDRSFVRDLVSESDDARIVTAVIGLAHGLGLRVVAEGVENLEQLEFLSRHQCDEVQGFYFSKPITSEELSEFLENFEGMGEMAITC